VLTSQGISFLHAGSEFLRTKKGNENSYNAGDSINAIDWNLKSKNIDVFNYVKALIQLRKDHAAFRMRTGREVSENIRFLKSTPGVVAYTIDGKAVKDQWEKILVIYNSKDNTIRFNLPAGKWKLYNLPGQNYSLGESESYITMLPSSCTILYQ
jgi:pullulanase